MEAMTSHAPSVVAVTDLLLTAREYARRASVSEDTVRRWARDGWGPRPVRVGPRAIRYRESEITDWLSRGAA